MLVGVCGGTGVGKTSLLNACLGIDELLPSGQEEAATAVPCKVSYNYDDRPGYDCLAEVVFQDHEAVVQELRLFVQMFRDRREAQDEGRIGDMEEGDTMIEHAMSRFAPVFKITENQIDDMIDKLEDQEAIKSILALNPEVEKLLTERTRSLQASTCEQLAKEMKKYLDSTEESHGDDSAEAFAVWPLISEVKVFVKSNLLRHGICLVDLPGIGDNNHSRNSVAARYQSQLHATIVVATIQRGKDTKDTNDLLGAQQQASMRLQGTLNNNHFAVAFTMMDNIEPKRYKFREEATADIYASIAEHAAEKKDEAMQLTNSIKQLETALSKAQKRLDKQRSKTLLSRGVKKESGKLWLDEMEEERRTLMTITSSDKSITSADNALRVLTAARGSAEAQTQIAWQQQMHTAIMARNRYVESCVNKDLMRRQQLYSRRRSQRDAPPSAEQISQTIAEIFMTSARGFWEIENKGVPLAGLPTKTCSGIPQLQQWILRSAALHREQYMDNLITDLRTLLEQLDIWSRNRRESSTDDEPVLSPDEINRVLETAHAGCTQVRLCFPEPLGHPWSF